MMDDADTALAALETAIAEDPTLGAGVHDALKRVPRGLGDSSPEILARLWSAGHHILEAIDLETADDAADTAGREPGDGQREELAGRARNVLAGTLIDPVASRRGALPLEDVPARGAGAWDPATAATTIAPLLLAMEPLIAKAPTRHVPFVWATLAAGYAPCRTVVADWVSSLEARGLGVAGLVPAIRQAAAILKRASDRSFSWREDGERMLALAAHESPVLAFAAATWLGQFAARAFGEKGMPKQAAIMARIASLARNRRLAASAFASAATSLFPPDSGLFPYCNEGVLLTLSRRLDPAEGVSVEDWVLAVLEACEGEPFLPMYRRWDEILAKRHGEDAAFASRLLEAGHPAEAAACALAHPRFVPGMEAVLKRLAAGTDAPVAAAAVQHLAAFYGPDADCDPTGFPSLVARLEAGIDAGDPDAIIAAWRDLKVPARPDGATLKRFLRANFRVLGIGDGAPLVLAGGDKRAHAHLAWVADSEVTRTFYDAEADNRARIRQRIARARARGRAPSRWDDESRLPNELTIPFTPEEAGAILAPFLDHLARRAAEEPTAPMPLLWNVWLAGYPPIRAALSAWLDDLESTETVIPGTRRALGIASALYDEVEAIHDGGALPDLAEALARVVPLIDDPHPMVLAQAHRFVGALYGHVLGSDADTRAAGLPPLRSFVAALAERTHEKARAAGAFVDGFGEGGSGLLALLKRPELSDFDADGWVVVILKGSDEPYLPGTQAFWFYVHEAYCDRPDVAHRLIDAGDPFTALMCATELDPPASGMDAVLERIAAGEDPDLARSAREALARIDE